MFVLLALLGFVGLALSALVIADVGDDDTEAAHSDDRDGDTSLNGFGTTPFSTMVPNTNTTLDTTIDQSEEGRAVIFGGDDDSEILTGAESDFVDAEGGNDAVHAGGGDDEVIGGPGDDQLFGQTGDDHLTGSVGDDVLYGGAGEDTLQAGDGNDQLFGGSGDDALQGYLGDDTLDGGVGADVLFGGAGSDLLNGGDDLEVDFLNGGDGDDILNAAQNDHLNGGDGNDVFSLPLNANAYIDDYNCEFDLIEVEYSGGIEPVLSKLEDASGTTLFANGDVVASFAAGTSLELTDIAVVAA